MDPTNDESKERALAQQRQRLAKTGFTLIELLTVIGIIAVLASMMLPALKSSKEQAYRAVCLNNFHQIAIAIRLYVDENESRFPMRSVYEQIPGTHTYKLKDTQPALGGKDAYPLDCFTNWVPSPKARPLYPYIANAQTFRCPRDKGQTSRPLCKDASHVAKPSNWETIGCSYQYNAGVPDFPMIDGRGGATRLPGAFGVDNKVESWVPDPIRFILAYEPPARPYGR
jgi:prepilin-type N-terminal cleavage/methylation domain-containing protein